MTRSAIIKIPLIPGSLCKRLYDRMKAPAGAPAGADCRLRRDYLGAEQYPLLRFGTQPKAMIAWEQWLPQPD